MSRDILSDVKIVIKTIKEDETTKATVILDFGIFKIKGFRVRFGKYGLWIDPPSILVGGQYRMMFFMEDKILWKKLQEKIIDQYNKQDIPIIEDL